MRARDVVVFLAGSMIVAAACAAQNAVTNAVPSDAGRDAVGVSDVRELDAETVSDDAAPLIDFGLPEAKADDATTPAAFNVDDVPCDQQINGVWYAVKAYPGRTKEDLARVKTVVCGVLLNQPPGFDCSASFGVLVRDGEIAAMCGSTTKATSVRVVLPN